MTKTTNSPKRWRPRFSLRTLVIFVTLVCVYFGAWEATKTFGVPAVTEFAHKSQAESWVDASNAESPLPFYVRSIQLNIGDSTQEVGADYRRDYLWFFGWIVHLNDKIQAPEPFSGRSGPPF